MAKLTIGFAVALIALGIGCFVATGSEHPTAMMPAFFGGGMLIAGIVALNPKLRMHAMHGAVMVSLLGCIGAVVMLALKRPAGIKLLDMSGMAILTGVFTALCVRSFISARRSRKASAVV